MKINKNDYIVLDDLNIKSNKTKDLLNVINALKVLDKKIIMITQGTNNSLYLSSRNLKNINSISVDSFSTYDLIDSNFLIIDKISVEILNESLNN